MEFSTASRKVPDLIDCLKFESEDFQCLICVSIPCPSPRVSSGSLGPLSERISPEAEAFRDLERSNKSTPSHERRWQLSGPEIPGAHISEEGNLLLITSNDFANLPRLLANCGESVRITIDGSRESSERALS